MEKVVVWALVCLSRFDNLYLPHSYIQAHLTGCQGLAKHAATAQKEVADSWKKDCRDALADVAKFIYNLIFWDLYLFEWLKNRKAHSGEVMAQIASLLITMMMANDQQVRKNVTEHWRYIKPEKKLDIMTTIENNEGNALPGSVLRLLICLPNDEKTLLPCASEAMQKLRNPVICLWRQGWSREDRRLLRKGRLWLKRLPRGLEEVIKRKVTKREDVKNALVKPDVVAWPKMRNIQVDAADERWNPAAVLRSWISVQAEAAEAAEQDAGAEEVAEEQEQPEEEQETGAEAEPEQGLQLAAPDAAVASAGPSGVVEGTKLSEEEILKIVEAKRKKTTLRTIWSTWQDVVNEANREVSVEEREHLEALRVLGDLEELGTEHKIRYRTFVLPMRRRHAEEEARLKDLQKVLKQVDAEKLQEKNLEKAKGNKAGEKGAKNVKAMAEVISKAQTNVQKLLKFSEDFQKNEITPHFLIKEAEGTVTKILMTRRVLMGVGKLATPTMKKATPVFFPSETCLPSLLHSLELESYLYPTWICEQLKRRLARLRGEAVNFQGAPILWGPRRRWDSRARTFSIEEAVKLCKDMKVAAPMPVTQTPEDFADTANSTRDVEAAEAETPDAPADLVQETAETGPAEVEAEEQPGETGQPEVAEPEDQLEDQPEEPEDQPEEPEDQPEDRPEDQPEAAEPSEALPEEASKDPKVAPELAEESEESIEPQPMEGDELLQAQVAKQINGKVFEGYVEDIEATRVTPSTQLPPSLENQSQDADEDPQDEEAVEQEDADEDPKDEEAVEQEDADEDPKDEEAVEQEAALNSALEEEGAEAEDSDEGHQDPIEESKEEQGEQAAPECAKETTEPQDKDSVGQGELAENPPDEKDATEKIAEPEDLRESPEGAEEHLGPLDTTSPQKEGPRADAEGGNDQAVSPADAQAELEERQRKKAAKFEKKRQQKKETQEDLAVEDEPDPELLAKWCEDEKDLRDKAVKLSSQLCKSLAELMNSNSNTNKQGQKAGQKAPSRRFLQQLKEKADSKVAEWQDFCNCPGSDVFTKNQALWTQKRRKRFTELMDCQEDLEWGRAKAKADEKISLMQRGITSPERGAWAFHYGVEIIMSQSCDLSDWLSEYLDCDLADGEPEPKLDKKDRDGAITILKMMDLVWKLAPGLAKQSNRRDDEEEEDEADEQSSHATSRGQGSMSTQSTGESKKGSIGPPPSYDGSREPGVFDEFRIRAKLWLFTTNIECRARGPRLLQALSGKAFESVKHLIDDQSWLDAQDNGDQLLELLSKPEYYGKEELESLYHAMFKLFFSELRKADDDLPAFRSRFEQAVRKVKKHKVELPQEALGFLFLKQAKISGESLERLITLTKGDLKFDSVVDGLRRLKMRLLDGDESKCIKNRHLWVQEHVTDRDDDVQHSMSASSECHDDDDMDLTEQALADLDSEDTAADEITEDGAREILMTLIKQKISKPINMSYRQVQQQKKEVRNSRGYRPINVHQNSGGSGMRRDLQQLKAVTRCKSCGELGHWHRECPQKNASKSSTGSAAGSNASSNHSWWSIVQPIDEVEPNVKSDAASAE
eukprot:s367_g33.t2